MRRRKEGTTCSGDVLYASPEHFSVSAFSCVLLLVERRCRGWQRFDHWATAWSSNPPPGRKRPEVGSSFRTPPARSLRKERWSLSGAAASLTTALARRWSFTKAIVCCSPNMVAPRSSWIMRHTWYSKRAMYWGFLLEQADCEDGSRGV